MNLEENCNQSLYRDNIYQLRNKKRQQKHFLKFDWKVNRLWYLTNL